MKKLMTLFANSLFFLVLSSLCAEVVSEVESKKLDSTERYIVKSRKSAVLQGTKKVGKVPLGSVLDVSHHRGPWRYSKQANEIGRAHV